MERFWRYVEAIYHDHGWIAALIVFLAVVGGVIAIFLLTDLDINTIFGWLS